MTIQHGRRQHASWSSDRYRHYVENIVSRLAIHYGNNPTVIGWQIDNEPGHYGVVDYSENAQAKFRIWLQKKYGTIDKLNDTWGASFWSETYHLVKFRCERVVGSDVETACEVVHCHGTYAGNETTFDAGIGSGFNFIEEGTQITFAMRFVRITVQALYI